MMDNTKEYILCAAIRRKEPRASSGVPYHKSDILDVELGYRHHDIYQRFEGELSLEMKDQGFYTQSLPADDDFFGPAADAAVRAFQKKRGLTVDGIVGRETWPALLGL